MTMVLRTFPVSVGCAARSADGSLPPAELSDVELFEVIAAVTEQVGPEVPAEAELVRLAETLEARLACC